MVQIIMYKQTTLWANYLLCFIVNKTQWEMSSQLAMIRLLKYSQVTILWYWKVTLIEVVIKESMSTVED
jgi:hypothetical protein